MRDIFRTMFTGNDNASYEVGRALWALSVVAGVVYAGAHLWKNASFSIVEFGTGMGALIGMGGFGIAAKDAAVRTQITDKPKGEK